VFSCSRVVNQQLFVKRNMRNVALHLNRSVPAYTKGVYMEDREIDPAVELGLEHLRGHDLHYHLRRIIRHHLRRINPDLWVDRLFVGILQPRDRG